MCLDMEKEKARKNIENNCKLFPTSESTDLSLQPQEAVLLSPWVAVFS